MAVLIKPLWVAVLDGVELPLERHGVGLLPGGILPVPFGERPVPHAPGRAAGAGEVVCLFRCRAKRDFMGQFHGASFQSFVELFSVVSQPIQP